MITPEEQSIIDQIKSGGGSASEAKSALVKYRADGNFQPIKAIEPPVSAGAETMGDIFETGKGFYDVFKERTGKISDAAQATSFQPSEFLDPTSGKQSAYESLFQMGSESVIGFGDLLFEAGLGVAKLATTGQQEEDITGMVGGLAEEFMKAPGVAFVTNEYEQAAPRSKRNLAIPVAALEIAGFKLVDKFADRARTAARGIRDSGMVENPPVYQYDVMPDGSVVRVDVSPGSGGAAPFTDEFQSDTFTRGGTTAGTASDTTKGVVQMGRELLMRPGRVRDRVLQSVRESAERSDMIVNTSPEAGAALSEGVPPTLVKSVMSADAPTQAGMSQMLDIAESGERSQNWMEVPAESVTIQFDLLDTRRSEIGKEIEAAIDALPNSTVDMRPAYGQIDVALRENLGVVPGLNGKLTFTASALSPEQRTLLSQAYELLKEAGDTPSARVVHAKDRLFATLNREAYRDGVTPMMIKDANGNTANILDVMRDVYRTPLDTLSDGKIRQLNTEYAQYRNIVDQAQNTIFKIAKQTGVQVDPAEKATRLLRRIDSEAVSAPEFSKVVSDMDTMARKLGYTGASVRDLVYFANDMRPYYRTPTTSRPGGFFGTVRDAASKVLEAGAPDAKSQIDAIKKMLGDIDPGTATKILGVGAAAVYLAANPEQVEAYFDTLNEEEGIIALGVVLAASGKVPKSVIVKAARVNAEKLAKAKAAKKAGETNVDYKIREYTRLDKGYQKELKSLNVAEPDVVDRKYNWKSNRQSGHLDIGAMLPGSRKSKPKSVSSTKGITDNLGRKIDADKIEGKEPLLNTKREVVVKDLQGTKHTLDAGVGVQATKLKNGNFHILSDTEFVINKNQYENLKGQSLVEVEAKVFAPELSDTTEVQIGTPSALREGETGSGQDFKNWSESTVNNRGKDYSVVVVQAPKGGLARSAVKTKDEIKSEISGVQDEIVEAKANNKQATEQGLELRGEDVTRLKKKLAALEKELATEVEKNIPETKDFTGGHITAPNQLFHIRGFMDKYKGEDAWFNDEWQSDWMIKLRKEAEIMAEKELGYGKITPDATDLEVSKRQNQIIREHKEKGNVLETPWNPELENWIPSAIKRSLLEADARGAEWFVWTNAMQQKNRYGQIAQEIDSIAWKSAGDGKEITINPPNGSPFDIQVDKDGIMTGSSNERMDKELKGKHLGDALPNEQRKEIMKTESGEVRGENMKFGGMWADNLYELRALKEMERMTGQKPEYIDMGYQYKQKGQSDDGQLTDEQLEALSEEGIDPDLDTNASTGDLVEYFGEDHYVVSTDDNSMKLIPEDAIQSRWDLGDYRSMEYDSIYDQLTYSADEEIPYHDWNKEVDKSNTEGRVYEFEVNRWSSGSNTNVYMVKDGHWGSDYGSQYANIDEPAPKLVNWDDVKDLDAEDDGFDQADFEKYMDNALEDGPVQTDLFGNDRTKIKDIEAWIEANQFDGDAEFIKDRIKDESIPIDQMIESIMDDRGLDTIEGAANDWMERSGEDSIIMGDNFAVLDRDYTPFTVLKDEDAIAAMRAENKALSEGKAKPKGVLQPALRMTPAVKAILRGEKAALKAPTGTSHLLPSGPSTALFALLAGGGAVAANDE